MCKENGPNGHLVWISVFDDTWPFGQTLFASVFGYSSKGAKVNLDLSNHAIPVINTSNKTLETAMKTYK